MNTRWNDIQELYFELLELRPHERQDRLARCENEAVRKEVERLLSSNDLESRFLNFSSVAVDVVLASSQPRFEPGQLVANRYRVMQLIGRGGMGEVYEVEDTELNTIVALKTLHGWLETGFKPGERLRREVTVAQSINHPNICRVFHFQPGVDGDESSVPFLTMELVSGSTLKELLKERGPLTVDEAAPLLRQLLQGLKAAHAIGIVHRDLKPANLMITGDPERLVIMDFGLAKPLTGSGMTSAGRIVGTLDYMAPEQLRGEAGIRSDLYSFGLIVAEMIFGTRNAKVGSGTTQKRIPTAWTTAIESCRSLDPSSRPDSAAEVERRMFRSLANPAVPSLLTRRSLMALLGTAGAAALWGLRPRGSNLRSAAGIKLFVVPVENQTGEPEFAGINEVLISQLSQSPHFRLVNPKDVPDVLTRMLRQPDSGLDAHTAREVALRLGAPLVVFATLTHVGASYLLGAAIERLGKDPDGVAGRLQRTFEAANRTDLWNGLHEASRWIRTSVGETAEDLADLDRGPSETTTGSWQALLDFDRAQRFAAAGKSLEAINALNESLRGDSDFALAHMRRGDILVSLSRLDEGYTSWGAALAAASRHRLTKREEFRIRGMFQSDTWDFAGAIATYESYSTYYPHESEALHYRAFPLLMMGRGQESLEVLRRWSAMDPTYFAPYASLALTAAVLGDARESEIQLAQSRAREKKWSARIGALAAWMFGRYSEVEGLCIQSEESGDMAWKSAVRSLRVLLLSEKGDWPRCRQLLDEGIQWDLSGGFDAERRRKLMARAAVYLRLNDMKAAAADISAALDGKPGPWLLTQGVVLQCRAGRTAEAQKTAERFEASVGGAFFDHLMGLMSANLALSRGDAVLASKYFLEAASKAPPATPRGYLGAAYEKTGLLKDAFDAYTTAVRGKGIVWHSRELQLPGYWRDNLEAALRLATKLKLDEAAGRLSAELAALNQWT
jgi:hypothetical protein